MLHFFFLGLFQSLLTAIVLLRRTNKRPADLFLVLLVVCFAFHFLTSFLLYELVSNTYFRKGFMNFTLLTYGPLMLIFARKSRGEQDTSSKRYWWLLAPAVAWSVPYFAILGFWMAGSFSDYTYLQVYNRSLLIVMGPLNILCFLGAMRIARTCLAEEPETSNIIRLTSITGLVSVIFCLGISLYAIARDIPFGLFQQVLRSIGASSMLIVCLAVTRYALLADRSRVFSIRSPKTPKPAQLNKERQKEIYDQLAQKVKEERLFLDPDLNMEKLVAATGYSRHQVSEVLNQYADISFYPFINRFRVEQVCEQMKKVALKTGGMPSLNMLDLSYACGFKSKSSFNEYFRRFTGQTPSEYWNKLNVKEKKA